ncbi:MAG: hypothetical protein BGO08_08425 [Altererythrobacter sp. 66-12]|nr:MAG: hypothetical protein BGO08_08425 [Altererythrobacter sp. 66-12]
MLIMPTLAARALPENEQEPARSLNHALMGLSLAAAEFRASVMLYRETDNSWRAFEVGDERRSITQKWPFIAARGGAMCLYDFWMGTQAINQDLLYRTPTIASQLDTEAKERAQQTLTKAFPNLAKLRNAAGHPNEINATPERAARNVIRAGDVSRFNFSGELDTTITLGGGIHDGHYTCVLKGKELSYEISEGSADTLDTIAADWARAFEPAARFTQQQK